MRRKAPRRARPGEGRLRIIAGHWRSRRLPFPALEGVRPTPDRLRETLFNWLGSRVIGASCLDLFAGSGALGLEAASRGASRVTLVDRHPQVARGLEKSVRILDAGNIDIVRDDALRWLGSARDVFDIIFLDPPYGEPDLLVACISLISTRELLAPHGRVYLEFDAASGPPRLPASWCRLRSGRAGDAACELVTAGEAPTERGGVLV